MESAEVNRRWSIAVDQDTHRAITELANRYQIDRKTLVRRAIRFYGDVWRGVELELEIAPPTKEVRRGG